MTSEKIGDYNVNKYIYIEAKNAMTKRVSVPGKAKRVGDGERPVRVKEQRKSLSSSQDKR